MHQLSLFIITIVVISGALCSDYVIMSKCAHNKAIHIDHDGKVSVTDIPQNITIAGTPDFLATNVFKVTLYVKETQMYLCFNNHWRLVGMKKLQDSCYFKESIVRGYFEFHSIQNLVRRVGFTHRGKPVGPKKSVNDDCYRFTKVAASEFTRTQTTTTTTKTTITPTTTTITATTAAGSNNDGHSNNNSISGTSNSRPRTNSSSSSSSSNSNLNNNVKKSSTVNPHRTRHRHNSTRIGPKRQHHLQDQTETDTRLRHQSGTGAAGNGSAAEFTGTTTRRRRKKKKKTVFHYDGQQNRNNQYLNPRDPEHRRLVYEQHEHQQQQHQHQQHQQQQQHHQQQHHHSHEPQHSSSSSSTSSQTQLYDSGGDAGDIYPSIQDEYSNDDASAILPDLPNNLDSSTEYLYSSSVSSTRHRPNYNKKFLSHGSTNRRRVNSSHVSSSSSSSSSNWDRSDADPNSNTRSSSSFHHSGAAVALDSQASTRKYYRKSNPGLIAASLQSTIVGNSSPKDPSLIGDSKIAATNLGKMKTNHKDKSLMRLRKKIQVGS